MGQCWRGHPTKPMNMRRLTIWLSLLPLVLLAAGCDVFSSEPIYSGLSIEGFNYTPYNLSRFVVYDKYGNTAAGGGGDLMPGSGQGSLSCCYRLKGTDFTVKWDVYDIDESLKNVYPATQMIHKRTQVHFLPTKVGGGDGARILGLHFYPDDHVEFELRNDLSGTRIFYLDVWDWLRKNHNPLLNPDDEHDSVVFRKTIRLAAAGWIKYRLADTRDLQQYVYFTLLNPRFDEHPAVQKILGETKDKPGAFAAAMKELAAAIVGELTSDKFEHVQPGKQNVADTVCNSRDVQMLLTKCVESMRRGVSATNLT